MKKILILIVCVFLLFAFTSCDSNQPSKPIDPTVTPTIIDTSTPEVTPTPIVTPEVTPTVTEEVKPTKTNYFDYNGKLHIEGAKVLNQYNEVIQLNGVCMPISTNAHTVWRDLDKIVLLKEWGFNFARMGLSVRRDYDDETLKSLYGALDKMIELGMYCEIVSFNDDTRVENEDYLNRTKTFLSLLMERYKDNDNFIYTIGNEPGYNPEPNQTKAITMAQIDEYANAIIPDLRKIKSDAIIGIPTPYACSEIDDAADSTLTYDNLIYICHCYMSPKSRTLNLYRRVETAILNNKAIFFSEWSASSPSDTDEYINTEEAKNTVYLINKYNIPNTYYNYWPGADVPEDSTVLKVNKMGMIKSTYWNSGNYRDPDALTTGGHFILDVINGKITGRNDISDTLDQTIINPGNNLQYYWVPEILTKIKSVTFTDVMYKPSNIYKAWNMSTSGMAEVYCYLTENEGYYDVIYTSKNKMLFPESASNFFKGMTSLERIDFSNISTENVKSMVNMFSGCTSLKTLDLSSFDTTNVETMFAMFCGMGSLENLDLSSFNTPKLTNITSLFNGTNVTGTLNMKNFDFTNVTEDTSKYAFSGCNPTKLILKNEEQKSFVLSLKASLNVVIE